MKKSEISILIGLVLALAITFFTDTNAQAENIRKNTLRLHIIANDDSPESQQIKMQVKENINSLCAELYCPAENYRQAVQITNKNLDYIQQSANQVLKTQGVNYTANCSVENFYFNTTEYDGFTMPCGEYTALTIRLGKAQGKNWWCVVYPSLCRGVGAKYEENDDNTFVETENFRIKFKAVELWESAKNIFKTNSSAPIYDKI